jgi:CHAT domain-containing protein
MTKTEALRLAQVEFINGEFTPATDRGRKAISADMPQPNVLPGYSHSFYWAPFVLMGNWL